MWGIPRQTGSKAQHRYALHIRHRLKPARIPAVAAPRIVAELIPEFQFHAQPTLNARARAIVQMWFGSRPPRRAHRRPSVKAAPSTRLFAVHPATVSCVLSQAPRLCSGPNEDAKGLMSRSRTAFGAIGRRSPRPRPRCMLIGAGFVERAAVA